jgi:hypothetical protein
MSSPDVTRAGTAATNVTRAQSLGPSASGVPSPYTMTSKDSVNTRQVAAASLKPVKPPSRYSEAGSCASSSSTIVPARRLASETGGKMSNPFPSGFVHNNRLSAPGEPGRGPAYLTRMESVLSSPASIPSVPNSPPRMLPEPVGYKISTA